jgi:DNA repair protein RecN (Recombination protein N)
MLRKLRIEHLVLVDSCEICLQSGFHVITGETGSGKSVLLTAIGLLLGEKADASAIRHGEKMAVIEGEFDLLPSSHALLHEVEIHLEGETFTLRRELLSSGKTRACIDGNLISIGFLKRLGTTLIEVSDQHACLTLKHPDTSRRLLDEYGGLEPLVLQFQEQFMQLRKLCAKKDLLLSQESSCASEIERLQTHIDEINASHILDVDDDALFHRLTELEHSKETFEIASLMLLEIEGGKSPLQNSLFRLTQRAEKLASLDSTFSPVVELLNTACSSSREAINELQGHLSSLDHSDEERSRIEAQLKRIDAVKRRHGISHEEICHAKTDMERHIATLQRRDLEIEQIEKDLLSAKASCDQLATSLTKKRISCAENLAKATEAQLQHLNMPKALFSIEVTSSSRSATGDDTIRFFCTPNVGEKRLDVGEAASGGELARIFLAIQAVMADLFAIPTILFDEIDASIGGMTAHAVGETLSAMGEKRQVLAVTHFVQVASKAHSHFTLSKKEHHGRTVTTAKKLYSQDEKDHEHQRMRGCADWDVKTSARSSSLS